MFGVEPEVLRTASKEFGNGSDAVREAAEMISMLQLDAGAFGEVDAAAEFAEALSKFVGTHSQDLRRGSSWFTDAAEGLVSNAEAYQRTDDDHATALKKLLQGFGGGK
ncbi:Excreted virulence factor EspC, type VII ESX diderm [Lentzea albidocapillata subsp. violacea]|uniref:Excreted virulence factor EspC, type VII ESX diderm n=1 Tax=Lentzea albidocapillata subsp. violacea TaxID=128104 RepID=A0A1G9LYV7_9PSEU|nr:type VII secretion target [Lentzea albidocapillata]SDL66605.1 Excreted virulence factor EspC, type VII ESX diderm [Lentzea albidocapillata subsp. violacea]